MIRAVFALCAVLLVTSPACAPKRQTTAGYAGLHDSLYAGFATHPETSKQIFVLDTVQNETIPFEHLRDQLASHTPLPIPSDTPSPIPAKPLGWTNDYDRLFSEAEVNTLDSLIALFELQTGVEIAIVTFREGWVDVDGFDSSVLDLHNRWGVGKAVKNNGMVIGIAAPLRRIRISNGSGIVPRLSDAATKKIIDEVILPEFKKGDYFEGVRQGLMAIFQALG